MDIENELELNGAILRECFHMDIRDAIRVIDSSLDSLDRLCEYAYIYENEDTCRSVIHIAAELLKVKAMLEHIRKFAKEKLP